MKKENIEFIDTEKLKVYEKNNKKHPQKQVSAIAESIRRLGFINPILIDGENVILAGHGRLKAVEYLREIHGPTLTTENEEEISLDTVKCMRVTNLTDNQLKAYRIWDNKSSELGQWDFENMKLDFDELVVEGLDDLTGFKDNDFNFLKEKEVLEFEEDEYEVEGHIRKLKTKVKHGDLFKLGEHTLMCGSATSSEDVNNLVGGNKMDMCFTDPLYGVSASGGRSQTVETKNIKKIANDELRGENLYTFLIDSIMNLHLKESGSYYICYDQKTQVEFITAIKACDLNFKKTIVWNKNNFGLSGHKGYRPKYELIAFGFKGNDYIWYGDNSQADVWDIARPTERPGNHPTPKPVEVCSRAINNSSTPGEHVIDLFGGSGSTLIACEQLQRKCFMMELDSKYCQVIIDRWEKYSGKKAERIE